MKSLKNCFLGIFLVLVVAGQPLDGAQRERATVEAVVESVDQKISLLDQIIEHVNTIVDSPGQRNRSHAKKELTKLMKNKELDAKIKDAINDDIEIIKNAKTKREIHAARHRLLVTYNKINAQANVVDTIAEATGMVKNALLPEEVEEAIAQAKRKVEEAQEEERGVMGRWYSKAKRKVTTSVDYVFGKESSYAKTAFYAAVGAAILAAGAYGAYYYGFDSSVAVPKNPTVDDWVAVEKKRFEVDAALEPLSRVSDYPWRKFSLTPKQTAQKRALENEYDRLIFQQEAIEKRLHEKGIDLKEQKEIADERVRESMRLRQPQYDKELEENREEAARMRERYRLKQEARLSKEAADSKNSE